MFSEIVQKNEVIVCVCVEFSFDAFLFVHHCDDLFLQPNILNIIIRSSRKKGGQTETSYPVCAHFHWND